MDIEQVMDFLVEHRAPNLPPEALAEVFTSLSWCLNDEAKMMAIVRRWLKLDDEYRVAVSLWMDDIFPADSRQGLVALAADINMRFPALAERASDWIRRWDNAYGESL
ncbi:hypothetical protein GCM10027290_38030 [Micromonospora sonneratiae]|uniref:CdiI immunity protein domain-containing protein n=1 Tax=Micromonospora sonneratiae TaxID=1184706 RepID=A0ABW3Y7U7_9ACTN